MRTRSVFSRCTMLGFGVMAALTLCFLSLSQAQETTDEMEVVFFNPDSGSQNPVDATNALQTFCNVLNKAEGWNLRAYFFKKQKDLENFLDTRKVDLGILSQVFLVENFEKRHLVPFVIPVRNGKTTYRKVVIVQKSAGYNDLQDLKGKTLAATALGEENVPFINKIVFRGEIDVQTHFKEIKIVDSANSAIMAVMYGQVEAAAVTLASFAIMQDLNPQVKSKLTSIFTSAETPISPMVYFEDNFDLKKLEKMKKILLAMHNDPIGRQSMLAFQVEAWELTSMEDFRETEAVLKSSAVVASAKPVPTLPPVTTSSSKLPETVSSTPPVEPPVTKPVLTVTRTQVYKADNGNALIFNAWVTKGGGDLGSNAVTMHYSIDGASEKELAMALSGEKFTAQVDYAGKAGDDGGTEVNYTVQRGDTLGKIATQLLGSSKKYMLIATYNNIQDPNLIQVGQKLRIKTGEAKVAEVKYYVTVKDTKGAEAKSSIATKFIM